MISADGILTATFVVGAVVGNLLLLQYGARSRWFSTITGVVVLSLFGIIALSYNLSALVLVWPHLFDGGGIWVRIVGRVLIDVVLIALYVLLVRAQRRGRIDDLTPPEGVRQPQPRE
jgi:hypothetical protein